MSQMNVTFGSVPPPNPKCGAAYRVLYERYHPHYCGSRERRDFIAREFAVIMAWANAQGPDIARSYKWATDYILRDVDALLQMLERAGKVQSAYLVIPKPPGLDDPRPDEPPHVRKDGNG